MVSGKSTFIKNAINPQNSNCGSVGSVIAAATTTITTTRPPPPLVQNITQPFATKNHNVLQQQQGQGLRHNVSMAQGYGK